MGRYPRTIPRRGLHSLRRVRKAKTDEVDYFAPTDPLSPDYYEELSVGYDDSTGHEK